MIRESGEGARLIYFAFIAVISTLVVLGLAIGIGYVVVGSGFIELITTLNFDIPGVLAAQKWIQAASTVGLFVIPAWVFAWFVHDKPSEYLQFDKHATARSYLAGALLMLGAMPFIAMVYDMNKQFPFPDAIRPMVEQMEAKAELVTNAFLSDKSMVQFILNIVIIALLPAIGEEMFFRGVIQKSFSKWMGKPHIAIFTTALIFSAIHFQFYGFVPRFILGLFLGYMYWWSQSLWLSVIAHFVNNAFAVVMVYLGSVTSSEKIDKLAQLQDSSPGAAFLSAMFVCVMLYIIYKYETARLAKAPTSSAA
jgi:membrane protease YdiL (CAAX protease family)